MCECMMGHEESSEIGEDIADKLALKMGANVGASFMAAKRNTMMGCRNHLKDALLPEED